MFIDFRGQKINRNEVNFKNNIEVLNFEVLCRGFAAPIEKSIISQHFKYKKIVSNQKKVIVPISPSFYHGMCDTFGVILDIIDRYSNLLFIFVRKDHIDEKDWMHTSLYYFLLDQKKIKYIKLKESDLDCLEINNYFIVNGSYQDCAIVLADAYLGQLMYSDVTPHKKVYVSRRNNENDNSEHPNKYHETYRIDDERKVENFFKSKGFEIVYNDTFKNIFDQISFYRQVKTLAGLTGGGLTNSIFMKPGGHVIELSTAFQFQRGSELHSMYKSLCYYKNHFLMTIPNIDKKAESLIQYIKDLEKVGFGL